MVINKRKIIFIIAVVGLALIITAGTIIVLTNINKPQESSISPEKSADTIKAQAIEALKNNDRAQAKTLFEEAKQKYTELGDTDNIVDTEAQLYLIEHPSKPSETPDITTSAIDA